MFSHSSLSSLSCPPLKFILKHAFGIGNHLVFRDGFLGCTHGNGFARGDLVTVVPRNRDIFNVLFGGMNNAAVVKGADTGPKAQKILGERPASIIYIYTYIHIYIYVEIIVSSRTQFCRKSSRTRSMLNAMWTLARKCAWDAMPTLTTILTVTILTD